jgi:hypothetical protein
VYIYILTLKEFISLGRSDIMKGNEDRINITIGITEEIYDYYKIKASRNGTDIDTQIILTLIENMNSEQFNMEIPLK